MMRLFFTLFILSSFVGYSQIEVTPKDEEKQMDRMIPEPKKESNSELYFVSNWSRTNRTLTENEGLFGDSLGTRADETYLDKWSFGIGMRNKINNFLLWEGGIHFIRNGESYLFEASDTSFHYETSYSYIGMPVKIGYYYGDDFQVFANAGLVPQMFLRYQQAQDWTTSNNTKADTLIKTTSGYSSFVLGAVFNVGFKMNFGKNWSLLVSPEYRMNLTSSYTKQAAYIHKGRAFGVTFGLTYKL